MDIGEIISGIMADQHVTYAVMGDRLGISNVTVHQAVKSRQKTMSVDRAVAYLGAVGYQLVAVPKGSKVPSGGIVVEERVDG